MMIIYETFIFYKQNNKLHKKAFDISIIYKSPTIIKVFETIYAIHQSKETMPKLNECLVWASAYELCPTMFDTHVAITFPKAL